MPPVSLPWRGDEDAGELLPVAGDAASPRILVPLLTSTIPAVTDQIHVATALARAREASLCVINPIADADRNPCEHRSQVTRNDRELLDWAIGRADGTTGSVDGRFSLGRDPVGSLLRAVAAHDVDTLVLPGSTSNDGLRRGATERIATQADADVVVVNGRPGYDDPASVLLPVAGGPHSGLATDIAGQIAADAGAWIDVLHVVEADATDRRRTEAHAYAEAAARRIDRPETTATWVLAADDPAEAIAEQSTYYGLTVIGAPTTGRLRRFVRGSTNRSIRAAADSVVLSARDNSGGRPLPDDRDA